MNPSRRILLACGERNPLLRAALTETLGSAGMQMLESQATSRDAIAYELAAIVAQYGPIAGLIYVSPDPVEIDILSDRGAEQIDQLLEQDLAAGMWWSQAVARQMVHQKISGSIVFVTHITALVPTQRFSYSAMSQAALMNLARVGVLELDSAGIRFNFVVRGWAERGGEQEFVEQLRRLHEADAYPLLNYVAEKEIADCCLLLTGTQAAAINGATLTVDGGFSVSRPIRQLPDRR